MRLRPALMTCVIAALAIVSLRLTSIELERQASARNDAQREIVEVIARDAAGLLVLTQDYGLHRSDRAARQWGLVHERLTRALADYAADGPESADQVDDLQGTARTLPQLFAALRAAGQDGSDALDRREMLTDQLVNETRRVSDGAFDLSGELARQRSVDAVHQRWMAVAAHSLVLALTLVLAWLLHRRVLAPIDRLREVAGAVEGGDLSARSRLPGGDELSQLSQALDAMTGALQQRDAALRDSNRLLSRSEAFLARAGKMAGVGGWELELADDHLSWSGETRGLLGLPTHHVVDVAAMLGCFAPESERRLRQAMALARANGEGWDLELEVPGADGAPRWLHSVGAAERVDGRVVRLVGAVQDVTERRAAADALRHAMLAADAASAAKSQFLANMSHEIRTPMNAVLGLNSLLERGELAPAQRELVVKIGNASRSLLEIINAVLDLSKIEAGEMVLEAAPFDPHALLRDVAALFAEQARGKGIALQLDVSPPLPALLLGDGARLRQIVGNLVSNAIKFTGEGEVRVGASCANASARPVVLEITVEDSGIGIPAEALSRIFTPFTQADSSTSRRYGGTGLGLSIVRQLCELMGGKVDVSSSPGAGTRFVVHLPFEPADVARGLVLSSRPLALLLASDDLVQREALQRLCADLGWLAEPVADAAALQARLDSAPPDLLLLDHRLLLPLEAAPRQALQARLAGLPCVLMSRAATVQDAAGLRLPADVSSLFDAVHAALAGHGAAGSLLDGARGASAVRLLPGVRVLVADDSPINLEVAQRILEDEGAQVTLAQDGALAVERLRAGPQGFDAVLMDVQMPVLDGLAAARCIRTELGLRELPILALTAGALLSERQRALEAGMNDFVSKPFDPSALVLLLRQHVERARGGRLPVAARAAEAPAQDDPWPQLDGITRDEARQRLLGDVNFFARLLERLIDEFADLATEPPPPLDAPAAAARLHKLAGSAGLMAARPLRDAAHRGETHARAGEAFDAELAEVARLMAALTAQARPWLQRHKAAQQQAEPRTAPPLDEASLARLRQALQVQDLAALDLFEQLAPSLRATLDEARFTALRDGVGRLDFATAAAQLSA
ncbi:ATP-binding protein [Roseateles sp. BYS78W]|uniref:histidine kinase n=1 Tax=Pelomonas candidula TaxID=3299025 RepID=A0ABW7HE53_9BURK